MSKNVLIACPNDTFTELLRISLEENGDYLVQVVKSAQDMLNFLSEVRFDLVIIDAEIKDQPLAELAKKVMAQYPQLRVALIPPNNNPLHPSLAGALPHAFLTRPFFMPDLLRTLEQLLQPGQPPETGAQPPESRETAEVALDELLALTADVRPRSPQAPVLGGEANPIPVAEPTTGQPELEIGGLAQELENLAREPGVHAVVIASLGQVLAYTGRLLKNEADDLARVLSSCWDPVAKSDLINYGQLSENKDVLFYSVSLQDELILTVIYDADHPISKARSRAAQSARTLRNHLAPSVAEGLAPVPERPAEEDHLISLAELLVDVPAPKAPRAPAGPGEGWVHETSANGT